MRCWIFFVFSIAAILISLMGGQQIQMRAAEPGSAAGGGDVTWLSQGWNEEQREWFYHLANQGSHLLPYSWFLWLEQAESDHLLRENDHIEQLRFLREPVDPAVNPDGLPVGFVKDTVPDDAGRVWMGLTCAACHTAQLTYQGRAYRIDGGPGPGDLQTLQTEITTALQKTNQDEAKFARFARGVLGASAGSNAATDKLRNELKKVAEQRAAFDERNKTDSRYGFARVDAFGIILNEVLGHALGVPGNLKPPNAPVSYPFLWDAAQHEHIQWNGVAPNRPLGTTYIGPLARNVGEVLGVFGEVQVTPDAAESHVPLLLSIHGGGHGYASSVRRVNLLVIEELLKRLTAPKWPQSLPPIDVAKSDKGRVLFGQHCAKCHHEMENPSGLIRDVGEVMTPISEVGTDPLMAKNFANRRANPGPLVGKRKLFLLGPTFGSDESAADVLVHVIAGTIIRTPFEKVTPLESLRFDELLGGHELLDTLAVFLLKTHADLNENSDAIRERILLPLMQLYQQPDPKAGLVYKGRPLDGIWATAPYLHNGSVPNLAQLLLPAKDRVDHFYVGSREFDPVNVGFQSDQEFDGSFEFRVKDAAGEAIPGNSNAGHEYGTSLNATEREELVEYMKSL
jgi:RoxA-like, cytochrome c-like